MITDAHVFQDDHVPDRLLHRDAEVGVLARAFEPALAGSAPDDVVIHGPHGVGKSVLARHTFDRLQSRATADWAHVHAMGLSTAGVVRATLQELGADPAPTTPQEDLCLQLRERVDQPTVVVLDEGDELPGAALDRLLDVPLVGVAPIVHDVDHWLSRLDDSVRRRLTAVKLELDRYPVDELADILAPRARKGLRGSVPRSYLETVADRAAGGARRGIQTLRAAGEIAGERECAVSDVDVDAAHARALRRIRELNLQSLTVHHHVLYELIRAAGSITPEDLNDRYDRVADQVYDGRGAVPVGRRQRRTKLRKLDEYGLIDRAEHRHDVHEVRDAGVASDVVSLPAGVSTD